MCKYRFKIRRFRKLFLGFFKLSIFRTNFRTIASLGFLDLISPKVFLDRNVLLATVCEAQLRLCVTI